MSTHDDATSADDVTQPLRAEDGAVDDATHTLPVEAGQADDATQALPVEDGVDDVTRTLPVEVAPVEDGVHLTKRPAPADDAPPPSAPAPQLPSSAVGPDVPAEPARRLRVGTVVWGLVLAAIGVGILGWASGRRIDVELAVIVLVAAAGLALVVGSLLTARRADPH